MYIYGASQEGINLQKKLNDDYGIKVKAFIDTKKNGDFIVPIEQVPKDAVIVISPQYQTTALEIYYLLHTKYNRKNIYWYHEAEDNHIKKTSFLDQCCTLCDTWGNLVMPHIEYHIVDNCNLNCRGCSHFSPLYETTEEQFESKIHNIDMLLQKFSNVARLDILGGEPLLSKDLTNYIIEIRKRLPNTWLRIFTNGLLIPKMTSEEFKCIRDNKIEIFISEYKPTHKMIDAIKNTLCREKIRYTTTGYDARKKFNLPITKSLNGVYPSYCISQGCYAMGEGKLAICPTLMYVKKFNEVFHENLPTEGMIDLDTLMSGQEILKKLKERVPLCNYCIKHPIEWEVCQSPSNEGDFAATDDIKQGWIL